MSGRGTGRMASYGDSCFSSTTIIRPSRIHDLRTRRPGARKRVSRNPVIVYSSQNPRKLMIAGAPAAGKGTQSQRIVENYGVEHVCVGDLLRAEISAGSENGARAKEFMNRGELVPNEIVVDMVKKSLLSEKATTFGWLLDGYPRSLDQANAIEKENIRPDIFFLLQVPDEILVERVVGRRMDPETGEIYHLKYKPPPEDIMGRLVHRFDDTEEKVRNRLDTYHKNLDAILDLYKDVIVEINGEGSMDEVFQSIQTALKSLDALKVSEP